MRLIKMYSFYKNTRLKFAQKFKSIASFSKVKQ